MKVNKKLLPLKCLFFFGNAGAAPIIPFIPVIARELGFSSVALGWILTACPIITIFAKPLLGGLADKLSQPKLLLLTLLLVHGFSTYSIKWLPPLPKNSTLQVHCSGDPPQLNIQVCSDKLAEIDYRDKIQGSLSQSTFCKFKVVNGELLEVNENRNGSMLRSEWILPITNVSFQESCLQLHTNIQTALSIQDNVCSGNSTHVSSFSCYTQTRNESEVKYSLLNDILWKTSVSDQQLSGTYQFWLLFWIVIFIRLTMSVIGSLIDTICFSLLGEHPENYGKQRMWGAIGWGIFSIIGGILVDFMSRGKDHTDYTISFHIMLLFFVLQIFIICFMDVEKSNKSKSISQDVKNLFNNAKMWIFIVWCIVSGIYVSFVWNYLFWFIEDLAAKHSGTSNIKTLQGLVLTVHTYGGEIPFFFLSGRILKKIGHINAMTLVLFTFGLRFLLYSRLSDPWWILPIESLNGITFGIFYATMTTYASLICPPGAEATLQNLVTAIFEGVGTGVGGVLGGYLFKTLGSSQTFLLLGGSALGFGFLHVLAQGLSSSTAESQSYLSVILLFWAEANPAKKRSLKSVQPFLSLKLNKSRKEDDKGITFNAESH